LLGRPGVLAGGGMALALSNAAIYPHGLMLPFAKARVESPDVIEHTQWNSYSRIRAEKIVHGSPAMWGGSSAMPPVEIDQRYMNIDGDAGTTMFRFGGDLAEVDFLKYDVTNLAYYIRNRGRAAVIGVGGGRDLLAAYLFGFRDVIGVELNPIFIDYLTRRFRDFNRLADLPGVRFELDEARSWFANAGRDQNFDLVQMSMIDTWAATAVGAYSLSENGLYTVEGWRQFFASLAPDGVFTVSRWYSPDDVDETGRLVSLAKVTLLDMGVLEPQNHLFLASSGPLSTLIVGRAPLSRQDVAVLRETTTRLGFTILAGPDLPAASPALEAIMNAPDAAALTALSATLHQDVSAPTDDRPFFFNQLRMTDAQAMLRAMQVRSGVISGNVDATITLLIIILLSLILVVLTIILPALPSVQRVSARLIGLGTAYFVLIGLGFMLVEIGVIQRLSLFLGHPIHGLAVGLFAIILSTGMGSIVSDRWPITKARHAIVWCGVLTIYLALLPFGLPLLVANFEAYRILVRAVAAVLVVAPLGLLLGFGFPTGMRLVNAIDPRPTPWFWAINGAAGVLAASIAVAVNIAFSINVSIWLGAACYALIGIAAVALMSLSPRTSPTIPRAASLKA
jgi:SAM-dependent methyltransferase